MARPSSITAVIATPSARAVNAPSSDTQRTLSDLSAIRIILMPSSQPPASGPDQQAGAHLPG
ncbi:hypothetical protein GCM10009663_49460 [Kitasatospora arboriphila]|uniref:Uncharacterized protein n=1 Tax=Kitasatospora arboriphila TaxID=258052 RepID=A0ABP4EDZ7_9ACTN